MTKRGDKGHFTQLKRLRCFRCNAILDLFAPGNEGRYEYFLMERDQEATTIGNFLEAHQGHPLVYEGVDE